VFSISKLPICAVLAFAGGLLVPRASFSVDFDGSAEIEQRYFFESSEAELSQSQTSVRLQTEFFQEWKNGDYTLVFEPFARLDSQDDERTHSDVRQLLWSKLGKNYEFSAGIGRVFWGVTESQHLVDIINQTDAVENIDGEDKLGQPMIRYSYFNNFGTIDAFVLPYFRTRTFIGADGRLNGGIIVDNDKEVYESDDEQKHVDFAVRYSNTFGAWSVGLSWFNGTSREADILRLLDFNTGRSTPFYPQIDQFAADIQLTTDAWLFKLEAIQRNFNDDFYDDFAAATLGTEYTFVGLFGTNYDLGMLAEYSWDERDEQATSLFQNDLFIGARLALNNLGESTVLFGLANDLDNSDSRALFVEAATRLGTTMTLNIELRHFDSDTPGDPLFLFQNDSFIQVGIEYFFD